MIAGAILAAAAALLVAFGDAFELDASRFAMLGATVGAVLGLVPARSPVERAGAWAVGFAVAWAGYAVRLSLLPDTSTGRAVAAALVVLVVATIAALTFGRLPLWAALLGVAAMTGAYEVSATENPIAFTTESVTAATTVALAASVGFLITSLMVRVVAAPAPAAAEPPPDGSVPGQRGSEPDNGMGILDWTRSEA